MTEQPPFGGLREARPGRQLQRSPGIVEERGREHEIRAQPRVELCGLAAERCDADGVLEQPAGVVVVLARRGRQPAQALAEGRVLDEPADRRPQPGMRRARRRGTRGTRPARPHRAASRARGRPGRRPPRPRCERTSSCSRSRKRSTRPRTRTASPSREALRRAARRRSRPGPRCGRSGRRARARGSGPPERVRSRSFFATA